MHGPEFGSTKLQRLRKRLPGEFNMRQRILRRVHFSVHPL
jgi:hypothetical protein